MVAATAFRPVATPVAEATEVGRIVPPGEAVTAEAEIGAATAVVVIAAVEAEVIRAAEEATADLRVATRDTRTQIN